MKTRSLVAALLPFAAFAACARHTGGVPRPVGNSTVPRFETRIEVSTETGQHSDYAVADFDRDGRLDLAVIGLSGEVQIMLGNGGVFTVGQRIALGGGPLWIAAGDFDRDGDQDLAVLQTSSGEVTLLWNDGRANFTVGEHLLVGTDALAVVAGDANDDGRLDLIVSRPVSPEIVVFLGDGGGNFTQDPGFALPGGGVPFQMALGDVDGDLIADLVIADPQLDRVLIYRGRGAGATFVTVPVIIPVAGVPKATSIGDLDGDGRNDIVVSATEAGQFVVITDPFAVPAVSFTVPVDGVPSLSTVSDVTGDGLADLVACVGSRSSVYIFPQLPGGGLGPATRLDATGLPLRPVVADFDRNGRSDLMVLSGLGDRINLWLAQANGRLVGARNYETGLPSAMVIAGGDFDGDGQADVVCGGTAAARLSILTADGNGGLQHIADIDTGAVVFNVKAVDLDHDGKLDLVVAVHGGIKLLRNRSSAGHFDFELLPSGGNLLAGGNGPFGVAVADLDRDGRPDLAVVDFAAGTVTMLFGTAQPFAFDGAPVVLTIGGRPIDIAAGDFTGDGVPDLAVSRSALADIAILRNDGHGNMTPSVNLPVGTAPNYLIAADFDRDGRTDLVVSDGTQAAITVLFARRDGFESATYPAGTTPTALLAQDLTNDGIPDILVTSLVTGDFRVLVGDGTGGFPALFTFPGTRGATGALLQDMTGDGQPDLLISSQITTRVSLVRNLTR